MKLLGIPTRSDAAQVSHEYAHALKRHDLEGKLDRFRYIFSSTLPHNHVVEAFRDSGRSNVFMKYGEVGKIPTRAVSRKTARLLKPEMILNHYLANLGELRAILQEARSLLDEVTEVSTNRKLGKELRPYENCDIRSTDNGNSWVYVFNPYIVVAAGLDRFEALLRYAYDTEPTPLEKIAGMMEVADLTEMSFVMRMALGSYSHEGFFAMNRHEHQVGDPVHRLYEQNRQIATRSDIALTFEEKAFSVKTARGMGSIPAMCLLADPVPMAYAELSNRATLRSLVAQHLRRKSCVVINGVTYTRQLLTYDDESHVGYAASGESYVQIANLFGLPILQPDGGIIKPDAWAETERKLVIEYQENHGRKARDELLRLYDLDSSSGNPTQEKAIGQLNYSLNTDRFQID